MPERGLKIQAIPLLLVLVLLFMVSAVSAQTIIFSDLGLVDSQEIAVFNSTDGYQTLQAVVNTSGGSITLDPNSSYMLVMRPTAVKSWVSPQGIIQNLTSIVDKYGLQLLILGVLGVLVLRRR